MGVPTSVVGYTPPQPEGGPRKLVWTCGGIRKKKKNFPSPTTVGIENEMRVRYISVISWPAPHLPIYHPSHHRDNVTAPHGRPNLSSRLHSATARGGTTKVRMNMWWH